MNEVVIKLHALREQFLRLGSVPRHFLQRAVRLRQVYSRHRLAQQSQNLRVFGRRLEFLHEPVPKKCRCDCDRFPARAQRPGRSANALRMDPRKSGAALRHFKPRRAARLAHAIPLYGAFAAHRGQRFCCLTAIPCVFFLKRMAAHQRKQRSTSSSTILSATRWP